jgi:predicted ATPase/DNA-binding SARP family transcriptional activator
MLQGPWQIRLFGGFSLRQQAREEPPAVASQLSLLIAMLADRLGRPISRAELIEELWPNSELDSSRNRFRVLLATARKLLEPVGTPTGSVLTSDREAISLSETAFEVDSYQFNRHLGKATGDAGIESYKAADELYAGEFMRGRTEPWVLARRAHYANIQCLAQMRFSALLEKSGDLPGAALQIARAIEADPLREAPRKRALRLLVDSGDVSSALSGYEDYRKLLRRSVGLTPTAELQDWVRGLKSFAKPRRAVPDTGLLLEELGPAVAGRVLLPPRLNSFMGRSEEIAELSELLSIYRWITLTGPGGIGKTRLAIETARANLAQFGGGLFFVSVGESFTAMTLVDTILQQIHLEISADPLDTLRQFLSQPVQSGRNACLFVLDCIDHLSNETNQVVLRLLKEIPHATVLATARSKRGAPGEHDYPVPALGTPLAQANTEETLANPSVQLFVTRAQTASKKFRARRSNLDEISELCRRLEGFPLAIELAAAQVVRTSPSEFISRLGESPPHSSSYSWGQARHQSVQASLDVSLDSVPEGLRHIFQAVCVFRGSFDASAASIVADATLADLNSLAENSLLVRISDPRAIRFSMLDIVRDLGWFKLSDSERAKLQANHAAYYRQLVADSETLHLSSGIQPFYRLQQDLNDIGAAAEWAIENGDSESAVRFAASMAPYWIATGLLQDGRMLVERVRSSVPLSELQSARLDAADGMLVCFMEDVETGVPQIQRALPIFDHAGLHQLAAGARWTLGYAAYLKGDFEECLALASQVEPQSGEYRGRLQAYQRNLEGLAFCELGDYDQAAVCLDEAKQIWQKLGEVVNVTHCRLTLTRSLWNQGRYAEAWDEYKVCAYEFNRLVDRRGLAYSVEGLGRTECGLGRYGIAAKLIGIAQRIRDSIGLRRDFADEQALAKTLQSCRDAIGSRFESERSSGYAIRPEDAAEWVAKLEAKEA